jgi:hypothetical protein
MTLVPHDLPDYVELGGQQVWRAPYTARHAEIVGFAVKADRAAIDALLHEALVEPAKGAVNYRCANEYIMVTFARIERLASGDPVDEQLGYMEEREVTVWCLAADATAGGRLVWYLPYVFTDTGQTVATGREVYGYPKQIGVFDADYPDRLVSGGDTIVQALAIDPFGPDSEATLRPMILARHVPAPGTATAIASSAQAEFFEEFAIVFRGELQVSAEPPFGPAPGPSAVITPVDAPAPQRSAPSLPWVRRVIDALQRIVLAPEPAELIFDMINNPTLVFLKQFRDVSCATKACYQAVVEAPLAIDPIGATYHALDADRFVISFADWASHPIATDLGITPRTAVTPARVFKATLDFDIELGQEVWRAPT